MRACLSAFILTSVLLAASYVAAIAQHTRSTGVTVTEVKRHALARVRTYTWTVSHPSLDKTADKQIIAAVDRELTTLRTDEARHGTRRCRGHLCLGCPDRCRFEVEALDEWCLADLSSWHPRRSSA